MARHDQRQSGGQRLGRGQVIPLAPGWQHHRIRRRIQVQQRHLRQVVGHDLHRWRGRTGHRAGRCLYHEARAGAVRERAGKRRQEQVDALTRQTGRDMQERERRLSGRAGPIMQGPVTQGPVTQGSITQGPITQGPERRQVWRMPHNRHRHANA